MTRRMTVTLPDATGKQVDLWAERLGLTKSQFLGMAVQSGIGHIIKAVSPLDAYTPEQLKRIADALGVDVSKEDFNEAQAKVGAPNRERGNQ